MFSGVAWGGSGVLRDYSGALMRFRGFRGFSGVFQENSGNSQGYDSGIFRGLRKNILRLSSSSRLFNVIFRKYSKPKALTLWFSGQIREFSGVRFMDFQGIENNYTSFKFPKRVVQAYFQEIFKTISPDLRVFRTNQGSAAHC